jgi:hypothetical protein
MISCDLGLTANSFPTDLRPQTTDAAGNALGLAAEKMSVNYQNHNCCSSIPDMTDKLKAQLRTGFGLHQWQPQLNGVHSSDDSPDFGGSTDSYAMSGGNPPLPAIMETTQAVISQ